MLPPVPPALGDSRDAGRLMNRVAALLVDAGDRHAHEKERGHRGEHRPAVADRAGHPAQRVGQSRADREDQDELQEVAPASGS